MHVVREILERNDLVAPDGRPLHGYGCTEDKRKKLSLDLRIRIASGQVLDSTASGFVLWAAEHIRSQHSGGQLTWAFVFGELRLSEDRAFAVRLVERGMQRWRRQVRRSEAGINMYLYSLMAEGGLPDALIADAGRYQGALVATIREIEAEGTLGPEVAQAAGRRHVSALPQVFRTEETARLLSDLAQVLVELRQRLPEDLAPEAAERWLDTLAHGWRNELPLRLSTVALTALVRPALAAERGTVSRAGGPLVRRELRRRIDGKGWAGCAVLADGGLLPSQLLEGVDPNLRLRLLPQTSTGAASASLLGVPEQGGWRLSCVGARGDLHLMLEPDQPLVLSAHADGRLVGEVVADAGIPTPDEAASLWRSIDPDRDDAASIVPLVGRGRTRADRVWLLGPLDSPPVPSPGIDIGSPESAPRGYLWPLTGRGEVVIAGARLRISTGEETEEDTAQFFTLGKNLAAWRAIEGVTLVRGSPDFWGAIGEGALRHLGKNVEMRPLSRLLCGQIAEWRLDGEVVARMRLVTLPDGLALRLRETRAGEVRLEGEGLGPGWHVALTAQGAESRVVTDATGIVSFEMATPGRAPGLLRLRLSDPHTGAALLLEAPWPLRSGMLVDPQGKRLERDQPVALGSLDGWRGYLPSDGGALQMRVANGGTAVAVHMDGEVRLAAYKPLLRSTLALAGPDARVNLRMIAGGDQGHRLEIGRYDWAAKVAANLCRLGPGRTHLYALTLREPLTVRNCETDGEIDLCEWLGHESTLWLVQGHSDLRGVMRPFAWPSVLAPFSTRARRVGVYAAEWERLLDLPSDPGWSRLWALIGAAREGGDAGALDQVQALGQVPAAAVAIVFRVKSEELAEAIEIEDAAPIWWPLVCYSDWAAGLCIDLDRQRVRFRQAEFEAAEAEQAAQQAVAQRAGQILALRPELQGHLAHAFRAAEMQPFALSMGEGHLIPLCVTQPQQRLETLAQDAAKRFSHLPDGTGRVAAQRLNIGENLNPELRPLLDAPLVVAEVASGLRPQPRLTETLRILALRLADPAWFDAALPAALALAFEVNRHG